MHACARLHNIGNDETNDQCQCGKRQEVDHGLTGHAPDFLHVGHTGNAGCYRQEDHRSDDHLHELDKGIAQRLQRGAKLRIEMSKQNTCSNREQNLHIKLLIKWDWAAWFSHSAIRYGNHDVLRLALSGSRPASRAFRPLVQRPSPPLTS